MNAHYMRYFVAQWLEHPTGVLKARRGLRFFSLSHARRDKLNTVTYYDIKITSRGERNKYCIKSKIHDKNKFQFSKV